MEKFNEKTLAKFNGKDEKSIYIAYKGKVYDVTESRMWKTGTHMNRHFAGKDLTNEIGAAPHGEEVLSKFKVVGIFESTGESQEAGKVPGWLGNMLERHPSLKRHPHPIFAHFPIAFMIGSSLFAILYAIFDVKSFEATTINLVITGLIFSFFAILTGFLTWYINYMAKPIRAVKIKIAFSFIMDADAIFLIFWHSIDPQILLNLRDLPFSSLTFFVMTLFLGIFAVIIGYYGGELVFPVKKS